MLESQGGLRQAKSLTSPQSSMQNVVPLSAVTTLPGPPRRVPPPAPASPIQPPSTSSNSRGKRPAPDENEEPAPFKQPPKKDKRPRKKKSIGASCERLHSHVGCPDSLACITDVNARYAEYKRSQLVECAIRDSPEGYLYLREIVDALIAKFPLDSINSYSVTNVLSRGPFVRLNDKPALRSGRPWTNATLGDSFTIEPLSGSGPHPAATSSLASLRTDLHIPMPPSSAIFGAQPPLESPSVFCQGVQPGDDGSLYLLDSDPWQFQPTFLPPASSPAFSCRTPLLPSSASPEFSDQQHLAPASLPSMTSSPILHAYRPYLSPSASPLETYNYAYSVPASPPPMSPSSGLSAHTSYLPPSAPSPALSARTPQLPPFDSLLESVNYDGTTPSLSSTASSADFTALTPTLPPFNFLLESVNDDDDTPSIPPFDLIAEIYDYNYLTPAHQCPQPSTAPTPALFARRPTLPPIDSLLQSFSSNHQASSPPSMASPRTPHSPPPASSQELFNHGNIVPASAPWNYDHLNDHANTVFDDGHKDSAPSMPLTSLQSLFADYMSDLFRRSASSTRSTVGLGQSPPSRIQHIGSSTSIPVHAERPYGTVYIPDRLALTQLLLADVGMGSVEGAAYLAQVQGTGARGPAVIL